MAFKRMHLIPATIAGPPSKSPYTRPLTSLDVSMREILTENTADEYEKAKLYDQVLKRYLDINQRYANEPAKVSVTAGGRPPRGSGARPKVDFSTSSTSSSPETAFEQFSADEKFRPNLSDVPKMYRGRVSRFLTDGRVKYDNSGQIINNEGRVIPGSNVVQLVLARISNSKTLQRRMADKPGMSVIREAIPHKKSLRRSIQVPRRETPVSHDLVNVDSDLINFDRTLEARGLSPIPFLQDDYFE
jgi:hypothetical protein